MNMAAKALVLIIAGFIVVSINGQSTVENEEILSKETDGTQKETTANEGVDETQKLESLENQPEENPVDTNNDTNSEPPSSSSGKPVETTSDTPVPVTETRPVESESNGQNQMFVLVPVPPSPFPNYVPMPPMYPGHPQPMQPQLMFNQPPMPFMPMPHPMMFHPQPPPPPSFIIKPAGNAPTMASNGQPTVIMPPNIPMFYPQQNSVGTPQVVVLNQQKNPSDVVVGQSAVYFNKPDKNQEVIIIKSS